MMTNHETRSKIYSLEVNIGRQQNEIKELKEQLVNQKNFKKEIDLYISTEAATLSRSVGNKSAVLGDINTDIAIISNFLRRAITLGIKRVINISQSSERETWEHVDGAQHIQESLEEAATTLIDIVWEK